MSLAVAAVIGLTVLAGTTSASAASVPPSIPGLTAESRCSEMGGSGEQVCATPLSAQTTGKVAVAAARIQDLASSLDPSCVRIAPATEAKALGSRTAGCTVRKWVVQRIETVDGVSTIIGQALVTTFVLTDLNPKARIFAVKVGAVLTDSTGPSVANVDWLLHLDCSGSGSCGSVTGDTHVNLTPDVAKTTSLSFSSSGSEIAAFRIITTAQAHIMNTDNTTEPFDIGATNEIQCDSDSGQAGFVGCVHHEFVPTYILHKTGLKGYPNVWAGDLHAINVDHKPTTLHRLIDGKDPSGRTRKQNRDIACAGFVTTGPLDSCDEYPYAATLEGGTGAHTWHVPLDENTTHGSQDLGRVSSRDHGVTRVRSLIQIMEARR